MCMCVCVCMKKGWDSNRGNDQGDWGMADKCVGAHHLRALCVSMDMTPGIVMKGGRSPMASPTWCPWCPFPWDPSLAWLCPLSSWDLILGPQMALTILAVMNGSLQACSPLWLVAYTLACHFFPLLWSPLLAVGGLVGWGSPGTYQPTSRKGFGLRKDN